MNPSEKIGINENGDDSVFLTRKNRGRKSAEIGAVFGITIDALTNGVGRNEKRREDDRKFKSEILRIKRIAGKPKQSVSFWFAPFLIDPQATKGKKVTLSAFAGNFLSLQ